MVRLWHMHSATLRGFYASDVYVSAVNQEEAVGLALAAYDAWLGEQVKDYGFDPLTSSFLDEPEYPAEAAELREKFHQELLAKLAPVPNNALIERRT